MKLFPGILRLLFTVSILSNICAMNSDLVKNYIYSADKKTEPVALVDFPYTIISGSNEPLFLTCGKNNSFLLKKNRTSQAVFFFRKGDECPLSDEVVYSLESESKKISFLVRLLIYERKVADGDLNYVTFAVKIVKQGNRSEYLTMSSDTEVKFSSMRANQPFSSNSTWVLVPDFEFPLAQESRKCIKHGLPFTVPGHTKFTRQVVAKEAVIDLLELVLPDCTVDICVPFNGRKSYLCRLQIMCCFTLFGTKACPIFLSLARGESKYLDGEEYRYKPELDEDWKRFYNGEIKVYVGVDREYLGFGKVKENSKIPYSLKALLDEMFSSNAKEKSILGGFILKLTESVDGIEFRFVDTQVSPVTNFGTAAHVTGVVLKEVMADTHSAIHALSDSITNMGRSIENSSDAFAGAFTDAAHELSGTLLVSLICIENSIKHATDVFGSSVALLNESLRSGSEDLKESVRLMTGSIELVSQDLTNTFTKVAGTLSSEFSQSVLLATESFAQSFSQLREALVEVSENTQETIQEATEKFEQATQIIADAIKKIKVKHKVKHRLI